MKLLKMKIINLKAQRFKMRILIKSFIALSALQGFQTALIFFILKVKTVHGPKLTQCVNTARCRKGTNANLKIPIIK